MGWVRSSRRPMGARIVLDGGEQRWLVRMRPTCCNAPVALDPDLAAGVHHHLGDGGVVRANVRGRPAATARRRGRSCGAPSAGAASERGSRAASRPGVDRAGDGRVVRHLGHHWRAEGALHVACGERAPRFVDQHDAGGLQAAGHRPPQREVAGPGDEQRCWRPRRTARQAARRCRRRPRPWPIALQCGGQVRPTGRRGGRRSAARGSSCSASVAGTARRCSAAASAVGEASQSASPGPAGSGRPSAAGASPARSTSSVGRGRERTSASAAATTVVPLPPLADQQRNMTYPQEEELRLGEVVAERIPARQRRQPVREGQCFQYGVALAASRSGRTHVWTISSWRRSQPADGEPRLGIAEGHRAIEIAGHARRRSACRVPPVPARWTARSAAPSCR